MVSLLSQREGVDNCWGRGERKENKGLASSLDTFTELSTAYAATRDLQGMSELPCLPMKGSLRAIELTWSQHDILLLDKSIWHVKTCQRAYTSKCFPQEGTGSQASFAMSTNSGFMSKLHWGIAENARHCFMIQRQTEFWKQTNKNVNSVV